MMNFIMMTISITLGVLLSMVIMTVVGFKLIMSVRFMKWYMNKINDMSTKVMESSEEIDSQVEEL